MCNGLDIPAEMRAREFDLLSGGEKTRVNLARLILEDTDILLLDEPTNHLDLHAVEWLEDYLDQFKGTVLTISHDRYFLDRVVRRIVEIRRGRAEFYAGSYTFYAAEQERRYQEQLKQYQKEQAKIAQLEEAAEKMRMWAFKGMDKTYKRVFSMEKRIERIRTQEKPIGPEKAMTVGFGEREFQGDMLFTVSHLSKSFGERSCWGTTGRGRPPSCTSCSARSGRTPARSASARRSAPATCRRSSALTTPSAACTRRCSMRTTAPRRRRATGWPPSASAGRTCSSRSPPSPAASSPG